MENRGDPNLIPETHRTAQLNIFSNPLLPSVWRLLAIEFHRASADPEPLQKEARHLPFGFLRGLVLGLAGMTIAGIRFEFVFGIVSGMDLYTSYDDWLCAHAAWPSRASVFEKIQIGGILGCKLT